MDKRESSACQEMKSSENDNGEISDVPETSIAGLPENEHGRMPESELEEEQELEEQESSPEIERLKESIQNLQREIEDNFGGDTNNTSKGEDMPQSLPVYDGMGNYFRQLIEVGKKEIEELLGDAMMKLQEEMEAELIEEIDHSSQEVKKIQEDILSQLTTDVADHLLEKIDELWSAMDNQIKKQDNEIKQLHRAMTDMMCKIDRMVSEVHQVDKYSQDLNLMSKIVGRTMDTIFPRLISMLPEEKDGKETPQTAEPESTVSSKEAAASASTSSRATASDAPSTSAHSNASLARGAEASASTSASPKASASSSSDGTITAPASRAASPGRRTIDLEKALHQAVNDSHLAKVRQLLAQGARVKAIRGGRTVLHSAAHSANLEMINLLLDGGANVDWTDNQGRTPLHVAGAVGSAPAVALLIRRGARVDARDVNRRTPLHWAVRAPGTPDCVRVLLTHGADPRATDDSGQTPMQMARCEEFRRVLRCVVKCIRCARVKPK